MCERGPRADAAARPSRCRAQPPRRSPGVGIATSRCGRRRRLPSAAPRDPSINRRPRAGSALVLRHGPERISCAIARARRVSFSGMGGELGPWSDAPAAPRAAAAAVFADASGRPPRAHSLSVVRPPRQVPVTSTCAETGALESSKASHGQSSLQAGIVKEDSLLHSSMSTSSPKTMLLDRRRCLALRRRIHAGGRSFQVPDRQRRSCVGLSPPSGRSPSDPVIVRAARSNRRAERPVSTRPRNIEFPGRPSAMTRAFRLTTPPASRQTAGTHRSSPCASTRPSRILRPLPARAGEHPHPQVRRSGDSAA